MRRSVFLLAAVLLAGCEQLTGIRPDAAPCHGYAPYDSTYRLPDGRDTTVTISRVHVCGTPRRHP